MSKKAETPKKTRGDAIHTGTQMVLSAIPWVGGPAAVLFNSVIAPPLEQRRDEWMTKIAERLQSLENTVPGFKTERLKDNPDFIDLLLQATQSALRTSSNEKRTALRNAVFNAALGYTSNTLFQQMFVHYVDTLTERHLQILKMFVNPEDWFKAVGKEWPGLPIPENVVEETALNWIRAAFPDLQATPELARFLLDDLANHGLIVAARGEIVRERDAMERLTTELGRTFLLFIQEPG